MHNKNNTMIIIIIFIINIDIIIIMMYGMITATILYGTITAKEVAKFVPCTQTFIVRESLA